MTIPYLGESCALVTALVWAFAVIMFKKSGETVHPISLNLFKNLLAMLLILPTMWILGETLMRPAPAGEYLLMLLSGVLGIGISDTLFFKSLNLLGAGLSAIVDCLYSPFIIGLSLLWLNESLSLLQIIGVLMIISAVLLAAFEKNGRTISRRNLFWGIALGILSMACLAVGIVMIKQPLETAPLLWTSEIRLLGGCLTLGAILAFHRRRREIISSLAISRGWKYMITGSFLGAYVSLILWLAGMKYTQASIAAALNQSSNIFVFVFAGIFLKEVINLQRTLGIILGVSGVLIVTFGAN